MYRTKALRKGADLIPVLQTGASRVTRIELQRGNIYVLDAPDLENRNINSIEYDPVTQAFFVGVEGALSRSTDDGRLVAVVTDELNNRVLYVRVDVPPMPAACWVPATVRK